MVHNREFQRRKLEIGERIRVARQLKGLTQGELAEILKCSRRKVNRVEQGLVALSAVELDLLARKFGLPVSFFFERGSVLEKLAS